MIGAAENVPDGRFRNREICLARPKNGALGQSLIESSEVL
jgi:hypothetical protein